MRIDDLGLFWEDLPQSRKRSERVLGPMPEIPETGWRPPAFFPNIIDAPWIGLDCETWDPELNDYGPGWARGRGHIVGVSISTPQGSWYFPIRHTIQPELNLDPDTVLRWLRYSLSARQPKIGANLMYDIGWLTHEGVTVNGPLYDVQYAEGLIDETARVNLETIGRRYLRRGKLTTVLKEWAQLYYGKSDDRWREDIYRCPVTLVGPYAIEDAKMPYEILMLQWPILVNRGLLELFEMECKLIRLLVRMRFQGITVNVPYAEQYRDELVTRAATLLKQAETIAGTGINVYSAESLSLAFDRLGLPYTRTTRGNPSFTADFLKAAKHPFAQLISDIRHLEKLRSTFVEGYILNANINGKVFCSFHPMFGAEGGAKTGRFSSSDPNLQNIPTRTEDGKRIRAIFTHDAGHLCCRDGDYSQIEYRMLAHFATGEGADEVRALYNSDPKLDYHDMISGMINQITGFAVMVKKGLLPGTMFSGGVPLIREQIKTLNFALVYGVGKDHLAEMLHVAMAQANELSGVFHKAIPFARATMKAIADEVGQTGICTTILNRQTHFDMWEPAGWGNKGPALPYTAALDAYGSNITRAYLYAALNYRLQGSAADVMKKGMIDADEAGIFDETGVPRMTVHDELFFSDAGTAREEAWDELTHIMENTIKFKVPLRFDLKKGADWRECK